jgi:hypothetical protein
MREAGRVLPRRSARYELRGVTWNQYLAWPGLGTEGSASRSSLVSPEWWMGPPPIFLQQTSADHDRMTRSSR